MSAHRAHRRAVGTRPSGRPLVAALAVALTASLGLVACSGSDVPAPDDSPVPANAPYRDPALPVEDRVDDLLARMTLAEKVGQMTQAERGAVTAQDIADDRIGSVLSGGGSVPALNTPAGWADMYDEMQEAALSTRLGIPILYGTDAVHGHNNLVGATIFPHNIGLGATRDPDLAQQIARATAVEVAATGVDWTFAPCLCVVRDDRWGRTYESFGEDPALVTSMATVVTGYQGEKLGSTPTSVLATAKHFIGDGGTDGGTDQGDSSIDEAELRAVHLPPFEAAVDAGVASVMVSFSSWQGEKLHAHEHLLTDVLKGELGFEGFVVSDWAGIDQLDGAPGFTRDEVTQAVNAGIDMVMLPTDHAVFIAELTRAVEDGDVSEERVDDAVRRILTAKVRLGLFEEPFTDRSLADTVGSDEHRALARTAVARSLVVLSNEGALPVADGARVLVTGSNADDLGNQAGGWTTTWQGASGSTYPGTTILDGLEAAASASGGAVTHDPTGAPEEGYDLAVAVVGETPYAEYEGDAPDGPALTQQDSATLEALRASGVPTVVVVVSGRPVDLGGAQDWAAAVVAAWLPGSEGAGVADVLYGVTDASGTLPVSWPASRSQHPVNAGDGQTPLWAPGTGITGPLG